MKMNAVLSNYTASITELKKSPTKLLEEAGNETIAILNHNVPSAYLVPREKYERMIEIIEDYHLAKEVEKRMKEDVNPIEVSLDEL